MSKSNKGITCPLQNRGHALQGICLDLDGTLYNRYVFWFWMILFLVRQAIRQKITLEELKILYRIRQFTERARHSKYRTGLFAIVIDQIANETGSTNERVADLLAKWTNEWQPDVLTRFKDAALRHVLTRLRVKGYKLGVYSDYPTRKKLDALALPPDIFDCIVESFEPNVSALKPNTRGFREVCKRLGLAPISVFYFGDRKDTDGKGAHAAGMPFFNCKPIFFSPHVPVTRYLIELEKNLPAINVDSRVFTDDKCWICAGLSHTEYAAANIPSEIHADLVRISDKNYGWTARLLKCNDCGFIHAERRSAEQIEDLYHGLVDEEYEATSNTRRLAFADLIRLVIKQRPEATKLLDVGAGTGGLCLEAQAKGFYSEGVEPSAWAVSKARKQGVRMHEGNFPHPAIKNMSFDVITICDVIEHVSSPLDLLKAACRTVQPDGLVVIVTPDVGSLAARFMGRRWWHFRTAHVGHFTSDTMSLALTLAGLTLERKEYYVWRFPLSYLLRRLSTYLRAGTFTNYILSIRCLSSLWNKKININLFDSIVYFTRPIK